MRDDSANKGGKPSSITPYNTPSDTKLTVLTVLGDCLEESTNLVILGHVGSQTSCHPLINHLDLMGTSLIACPSSCFETILQTASSAGSVNADKLSLAGKKHLETTVVFHVLLGDKMTLSMGILEGNTGKLKNYLIITMECICA